MEQTNKQTNFYPFCFGDLKNFEVVYQAVKKENRRLENE